ncbi:MAG: hypothetical protein ABH851_02030 [Methanobacteriota archaeon]
MDSSKVLLKDGSILRLRPLRRDDTDRMIELFSNFSEETIHQRFFEEIKAMTPEKVAPITWMLMIDPGLRLWVKTRLTESLWESPVIWEMGGASSSQSFW